jgi:hypothetical protein
MKASVVVLVHLGLFVSFSDTLLPYEEFCLSNQHFSIAQLNSASTSQMKAVLEFRFVKSISCLATNRKSHNTLTI